MLIGGNHLHLLTLGTVLLYLAVGSINTVHGNSDFSHLLRHIKTDTSETAQTQAANNVILRTIPDRSNFFDLTINFTLPRNTFRITKTPASPIVFITASAGVTACKAFYHYVKYYCNGHISWDGVQLKLPDNNLPDLDIEETSSSWFIYYQNVCTWSYSFAWWKWNDWQKHIDWMALNGITLTLAPVQELIWTEVYTELGLTANEIDDHFTGPGFLAWQRMGNIRGWGGPITKNFKKKSTKLQRQIIQALQDLGIAIALPSFAGHVPVALKRIYPNATLTAVQRWNHFPDQYCCPLFIDPIDPLFQKIGKMFLEKIIQRYGITNHIYFSDPFNEIQPRLADANYLTNAAHGIYSVMKSVDEHAIWLLQGWMFVKNPFWSDPLLKAFLTAVPLGRMLVLDLQSEQSPQYERTHSYYGQPFVWCMLHNFGGTLGMHGSVDILNTRIKDARKMVNSTMIGVGITPEGINQNYALYEFVLERAWDQQSVDVEKWFEHYALTRYGVDNEFIKAGWKLLLQSVYSYNGTETLHGKYIVCRRPSFNLTPTAWYNTSMIFEALNQFLTGSYDIQTSKLFEHDVVDVARQFLQDTIESCYMEMIIAYQNNEPKHFGLMSEKIVEILHDLDKLLGSSDDFLLGKWLAAAKNLSTNHAERQLFEINARNQITIWGPNGQIVDYAMKQWSGMILDYCLPRWLLFFDDCQESLLANKSFPMTKWRRKVFQQIEHPFTVANKMYPTNAVGDSIQIARNILDRWNPYRNT